MAQGNMQKSNTKLRVAAQKSMSTLASYPRWAVFQVACLLVVTTCLLVAVPCFLAIWKPESKSRVEAKVVANTSQPAADLLPKEGATKNERLQVSSCRQTAALLASYARVHCIRNSYTA